MSYVRRKVTNTMYHRYQRQVRAYCEERHAVPFEALTDDTIHREFLTYVVDRPLIRKPGSKLILEQPIRNGLSNVVSAMHAFYVDRGLHSPINNSTYVFAESLIDQYGTPPSQASPLSPHEIDTLLALLAKKTYPHAKRLGAVIPALHKTWARPSEVMGVRLPHDFQTDARGVVLTVHNAKQNRSSSPERLFIPHSGHAVGTCGACALLNWQTFLGEDYKGPLFPNLRGGLPTEHQWTADSFGVALRRLASRAGIPSAGIRSYSIRRGGATFAAASRQSLHLIRRGLRQKTFSKTVGYIDESVTADLIREILEPLG